MDPYVYPGTNVLRNLRDIRDPDILNEFEAEATSRRIRQLEHKPAPGELDTRHLQTIHHHVFQDVYSWAGEFRTGAGVDAEASNIDLKGNRGHSTPAAVWDDHALFQ
jgi:fido (protein-threonine AMPylation protein)